MLQFAGEALDLIKQDKRVDFIKKDYFDGEYPKIVVDLVDEYVTSLLKGGLFDSVDVETEKQIKTIINDNISLGVSSITKLITDTLPDFGYQRALAISTTSVTYAVEGTREVMYNDLGATSKKWLSVKDKLVRNTHRNAESDGWVSISHDYGGFTSPKGQFRCRCTLLYGFDNEHLLNT
jgi:hypothetical protein